jgi:hypothetical protein
MNLVQRGTTASRANRGKSVNDSIAQRVGAPSYRGKTLLASLIPEDFLLRLVWKEKDARI